MKLLMMFTAATGLMAPFALGGAELADPGDQWKKQ